MSVEGMVSFRCPACGLQVRIDRDHTLARWHDGVTEALLLCCPRCDMQLELDAGARVNVPPRRLPPDELAHLD